SNGSVASPRPCASPPGAPPARPAAPAWSAPAPPWRRPAAARARRRRPSAGSTASPVAAPPRRRRDRTAPPACGPGRRADAGGGVGEEDADLAVVLLAEPAAPLPGDPARLAARLGEAAGVEDQDRPRVGEDLADVAAEFGHDGVVVPAACADEVLDGLAVDA